MTKIDKDFFKGLAPTRSLEEAQNEAKELQEKDRQIAEEVNTKAIISDLPPNFESEWVYRRLNGLATCYENIAVKFDKYEIDAINEGTNTEDFWNSQAKSHRTFAKDLRGELTSIIRNQRQIDRIFNLNNGE